MTDEWLGLCIPFFPLKSATAIACRLGVTRSGRFAFVTNYREVSFPTPSYVPGLAIVFMSQLSLVCHAISLTLLKNSEFEVPYVSSTRGLLAMDLKMDG